MPESGHTVEVKRTQHNHDLAISLIFGILVSVLLTLVVIPVMYYAFMRKRIVSG